MTLTLATYVHSYRNSLIPKGARQGGKKEPRYTSLVPSPFFPPRREMQALCTVEEKEGPGTHSLRMRQKDFALDIFVIINGAWGKL